MERSTPYTDDRFRGYSGIISGTIENLTPLFIGAQSSGVFHPPLRRAGKQVIPGSSLKGLLRSLAEIVGGGCAVVQDPKSPIPRNLVACSHVNQLCIACRMFGAMERHRNARVHKGKVAIGDAEIQEDHIQTKPLQVLLSNNGVRHEPFYRTAGTGNCDGRSRKLYFHQPARRESTPAIPQNIQDRAWNIDALLPGHHFDFDIQFTSLSDDELSLLLYVLCLEPDIAVALGDDKLKLRGPMRHKIGNAKPAGLGSCRIDLHTMLVFPPPRERFKTMTKAGNRKLQGEELECDIRDRIARHVADQSPTMQALRKMMVWDENDQREFHYPDYHWFKAVENNQTPLKPL
ncbi:MAG: RAMP superfamily CRISPR-associated protein [Pseudomonadota bacterium]